MSALQNDYEQIKLEEKQAAETLIAHDATTEEFDEEIRQLRIKIAELNERKRMHNENRFYLSDATRRIARKKYEVEQQLEVERKAEEAEQQSLFKFASFDELSKDAIWRKGNKLGQTALKHQIDGAYLLANTGRAILADSMGTGKTLSSLVFSDLVQARRIIIICPGEVMSGYENEIKKWTNRPPIVIGRKPKKEVRSLLNMLRDHDIQDWVLLINYEAWARDKVLLMELVSMMADTVICDEAHKIKETDTSAYKGVEQIVLSKNQCPVCRKFITFCPHTGVGERSVKNVLMMTGTPILNKPQEIYPMLHLINPSDFDNKNAFLRSYCELDRYTNKWGFRPGGMATLSERLRGMYLRRTRETAGIVLPKQELVRHSVQLDPNDHADQIELIEQISTHAQIEIEQGKTAGIMSLLAMITRQRQAATWPGGMELKVPRLDEIGNPVWDEFGEMVYDLYVIPQKYWQSAKMDAAVELAQELVEDGQRVVVFSQFLKALEEFNKRMNESGARSVVYAGPTPQSVRDEVKRNFDRSNGEEAKWDVVAAHYKTGGVGLTLTAATQIIILDEEWNPGMNEQGYGRVDRIGQTEETTVHIFETENTVDEWMKELNEMKGDLVGGFHQNNAEMQEKLMKIVSRKVTK